MFDLNWDLMDGADGKLNNFFFFFLDNWRRNITDLIQPDVDGTEGESTKRILLSCRTIILDFRSLNLQM